MSDLRETLYGEASEGGFWTPSRVLVAGALVLVVLAVVSDGGRDAVDELEEERDA